MDRTVAAGTPLDESVELSRELIDLLVRLDPGVEIAPDLTAGLRALVALAQPYASEPKVVVGQPAHYRRGFVDRSPVTGRLNPLAPPLTVDFGAEGVVRTEVTLGLPYQGPPGRVHGGWVATLLDHVMGSAAGRAVPTMAFTRTLSVDYILGTPLFEELAVSARVESIEGRKLWVVGEVMCSGAVTATGRGLWITPRE